MKLGKIAAAAAALSLAAAPMAAQADVSRLTAPVAGESENSGEGQAGAILAVAAVLAIVIGVAAGDSSPTSP